jgi:hypothetical protein
MPMIGCAHLEKAYQELERGRIYINDSPRFSGASAIPRIFSNFAFFLFSQSLANGQASLMFVEKLLVHKFS